MRLVGISTVDSTFRGAGQRNGKSLSSGMGLRMFLMSKNWAPTSWTGFLQPSYKWLILSRKRNSVSLLIFVMGEGGCINLHKILCGISVASQELSSRSQEENRSSANRRSGIWSGWSSPSQGGQPNLSYSNIERSERMAHMKGVAIVVCTPHFHLLFFPDNILIIFKIGRIYDY